MINCRPIRVLYVTHESNLTGASRSLVDLLSSLDRSRVEPLVLLRKDGPLLAKLAEIEVPYVVCPYVLCVKGSATKVPVFAKKLVNLVAARKIQRIIHDHNIDLIHNNSLLVDVGMRAARADELPYVCHVRELVNEDHGLAFIDEACVKDLMSAASCSIFISGFVADKFRSWVGDAPYKVALNAVNVPGTRVARKKSPFSSEPYRLFLPGRFNRGKGQLDAIKAVTELRERGVDVTLRLAGGVARDGSYLQECSDYIEQHQTNGIEIKSFIDDVAAEYACADAVLMCSRAEAMGRVTAEGMLSGALVIGADAGATPEIIHDRETGLLYSPGDTHDLARKIEWAIANSDEAVRIAEAGNSYAVEAFGLEGYAQKMMELYESLLG